MREKTETKTTRWATADEAADRFYAETFETFDFALRDAGDDGEFGSWVTLDLFERGKLVESETFHASTEFPSEFTSSYGDPNQAVTQALSRAYVWQEAQYRRAEADRLGVHPLELAFAPYGPEWFREREEAR